MKKIALISTSVLLSFTVATSAFARDFNDRPNDKRQPPSSMQHGKDFRGGPQFAGDRQRVDFNRQNQGRPMQVSAPHFKRGERLPDRYLKNDRYYVKNWHAHNLRQPPKGYRWVDVDGRYLLVSVVTGVIASILINS